MKEIKEAIEHHKHNIKTWAKSIEGMEKAKHHEIKNSVIYFRERILLEQTSLAALKTMEWIDNCKGDLIDVGISKSIMDKFNSFLKGGTE